MAACWYSSSKKDPGRASDMHVEPQAVSRALAVATVATGIMETTAQARIVTLCVCMPWLILYRMRSIFS